MLERKRFKYDGFDSELDVFDSQLAAALQSRLRFRLLVRVIHLQTVFVIMPLPTYMRVIHMKTAFAGLGNAGIKIRAA